MATSLPPPGRRSAFEFPRDGRVVRVDVGGIDHPEEAVVQRRVPVRLDGHRPGEQCPALLGPAEVVLDRHPAFETAVALAVVTQAADRTEHEQCWTYGDSQLPREHSVLLRVGVRL